MINVIADRYAQALFEVGEETQTTNELYQELSELVVILNENKDLYNFLKSPLIGREDKKNVIKNHIYGRKQFCRLYKNPSHFG